MKFYHDNTLVHHFRKVTQIDAAVFALLDELGDRSDRPVMEGIKTKEKDQIIEICIRLLSFRQKAEMEAVIQKTIKKLEIQAELEDSDG